MKYLIIGAGGTGGPVAAFLKKGGADVSVIARGKHLEAIKKNGLTIKKSDGSEFNVKINACCEDEYNEKADVIFVTVKSYSIDSVIPLIRKASHENTVVIPILNIYTTGEYLQKKLPELFVTDGCIYIASSITDYGVVTMNGEIFRVVFGEREESGKGAVLDAVAKEMRRCRILAENSKNIKKSALEKYSYVSAMAACGLYYDCKADLMQKEGKQRETFAQLIREIVILSESMGIKFDEDMVERNLKILDNLAPDASTSMQRDIEKGRESEIDGLIHTVARVSREKNLGLHTYEMISDKVKEIVK